MDTLERSKTGDHSLIQVPATTEEVTVNWFEKILNIKINAKSFLATGNADAGVGFLSNLVRVRSEEISPDFHNIEHYLVVELLPIADPERRRVTAEKMDKTELFFYKNLIPEIINEIPSLESYFCPFVYGNTQEEDSEKNIPYSSALVLKDLKQDGFVLKPFSKEDLSTEEIKLTIEFLAAFHASSVLLESKIKTRLTDVYDIFPEWCYSTDSENPHFRIHEFINSGFSLAKDVIAHYTTNINPSEKECGKDIICNLIEPFKLQSRELFNAVVRAGYQHPSLIHQDSWQNNILVSSTSPTAIKVIDWQMIGYSDSIYDLVMFLITSLSSKLDIRLLEEYAKLYFDKLEKILKDKANDGRNFSVARKRRCWSEFWLDLRTYGITFVFLVYIIGCNTAITFPENFPKMFQAFRFFHFGIGLEKFLSEIIRDKINFYCTAGTYCTRSTID